MKNKLTEIVFIIDRSGSMSGFEDDTIGGFNSTLGRQREGEGKAYVSTVLFDNYIQVIHDRVRIEDVKPMTRDDYRVGGCTALLDAIGGAIHHIGTIHKYARAEDVPEHTLFIIITDGMENASRNYSSDEVKKNIKRQTEKYGWEFIFLAANIDAIETAENIGIHRSRTVNYHQDKAGMSVTYEAMCEAITTVRKRESFDDGVWRQKLDEDNERRKKNKA